MTIKHQIITPSAAGSPPPGGDLGSQLSGLVGTLSALTGAGVGLPGIQSIGSTIAGLGSAITGAGGTETIANAITSLGSQLSSVTSMASATSLVSSLTSQMSSLTGMLGGDFSQVIHEHKLDMLMGIVHSAFQSQHMVQLGSSGININSIAQVAHTAPQLPHNGLTLVSDALQVTKIVSGQGFSMLSDRRLKTKIRKHRPVLADVLKLRLKTFVVKAFDWNTGRIVEGDERSSLGFIAQQFRKVFPELVRQDSEYLSIEEEKLGPILVGALQEFVAETRAEIATLKAEIAELKAQ